MKIFGIHITAADVVEKYQREIEGRKVDHDNLHKLWEKQALRAEECGRELQTAIDSHAADFNRLREVHEKLRAEYESMKLDYEAEIALLTADLAHATRRADEADGALEIALERAAKGKREKKELPRLPDPLSADIQAKPRQKPGPRGKAK